MSEGEIRTMNLRKLKAAAKRACPSLYDTMSHRIGYPARYKKVADAVVSRYGCRIVDGPFRGMNYVDHAAGSAYMPKILGCYEMEICEWVEEIVRRGYDTVIDVGCAEGYYAVGLAMRCPGTTVYAFDTNPEARRLCRELAALNGVSDRLILGKFCDADALKTIPMKHTVMICDIEGHEVDLLDPGLSPELLDMDIVVELHELQRPGVTQTLLSRFSGSHQVELADAVPRDPARHPEVAFLALKDRHLAINEARSAGQQFAFFRK